MSEQDSNQPDEQVPSQTSPEVTATNPPVTDGNAPVSPGPGQGQPLEASPPLKKEPDGSPSGTEDSLTSSKQAMAEKELPPLPEDSSLSQESDATSKTATVAEVAPAQASGEKHLEIHWLGSSGQPLPVDKTGSPVVIGRPAGQRGELSTVEHFEKAGFYYLGVPANYKEIECVSGVHAQVELRDGGLFLKDLNSTQGLKLNGKEVEGKGGARHRFNSDDTITLADRVLFKVEIVDGPFNDSSKNITPATSVPTPQPAPEVQAGTGSSKPEKHLVIDDGLDWDLVLQKCEKLISPPEGEGPNEFLDRTETLLQKEGVMGLAFEEYRNDLDHQAFKVPERLPKDADLWFIGDIHGDLLGMESSLAYIHHQAKVAGKTPWVIFLGDFIDRGPHNHEVMLRLFEYIDSNKATTCAIVGNHDAGFGFSETSGRFTSTMQPCEYPDWLNENLKDELAVRTGKLAAQFFNKIPKAFFLPDGLVVAHGCVPHKDITPDFKSEEDLNGELALKDFVNARIHAKMPRKRPNRSSSTHQLGREDFELFCAKATETLGQPVSRMVKGHEHIPERYSTYEKFIDHPMLVINNMCTSQGDFVMGDNPPCVARWRVGQPPEVHPVKIPRYLIEKIYDLSGATGESEDTLNKD